MMCYIFIDGDVYLGMSKNNYIPVKDIKDAKKFESKSSAENILQSSVPKILRKSYNWEIEEFKEESKVNTQYTPVDIDKLKNTINDLSNQLTTLNGNKEWLSESASNIDKQIEDILHFIEIFTFSASDGYRLCKALKELRLERRKVKNELEMIGILNCQTSNNIAAGHTSKAISGLETKQYTPRVLTELFENKNISSIISQYKN